MRRLQIVDGDFYGYTGRVNVSVAEARDKLSQLIQAVEGGERVTICRHGVPVADIVPSASGLNKPVRLGTLRGKIKINDPDWWKPMTDAEVDDFISGR